MNKHLRLVAVEQVMQQVIARRIRLAEAMKQFRDLNRRWPDARMAPLKAKNLVVHCSSNERKVGEPPGLSRRDKPAGSPQFSCKEPLGISEDKWDGRRVVLYVQFVLADCPDEAAAVIARLEKELQENLAARPKRPAAPVEKPIEPSR